ncbi:hypothetical protein L1264_03765 [Pseudoalteromonas sp. APAL1]|uniref:hypothetical protein n=1 Tax=Pseudoalteromonas sp. APAL1 TaxID=2908883 RepID=UPI001F3A094B|nr:hypothetical protein [Pseudoalteromonas sp. APAL1]MCF2919594.1 hypothetical protein [Pseudoalteromonas sp. APAL1]
MSFSAEQLSVQLVKAGCRSNFKIKNINEFMPANSKEAFYVHEQSGQAKIVIRPIFEVFSADFDAIEGITRVKDYFHSSEMTRFPSRIYKSAHPIHYGIAFKVTSSEAAEQFINKLSAILAQ